MCCPQDMSPKGRLNTCIRNAGGHSRDDSLDRKMLMSMAPLTLDHPCGRAVVLRSFTLRHSGASGLISLDFGLQHGSCELRLDAPERSSRSGHLLDS